MRARADGGQTVPLVAGLLGVALIAALLVAELGGAAVERAKASAAADAAALAGAAEGESAAREIAEANGARLVSFERLDTDVRVVVALGRARAAARARRAVVRSPAVDRDPRP